MRRIFLIFGIVHLFGMTKITVSDQRSKHSADQIIRDICDRLNEDDLYSDENRKWYSLCQEWIDEQKQEETIMDGKIKIAIDFITDPIDRMSHLIL